jgi:hypothetical protein
LRDYLAVAVKWIIVPEENRRVDDVEKILHDEKSLEDRKQAVIADLLKQREAAIAAFDEKLAKLGYHANSGKAKRSHHKRGATAAAPAAPAKAADKPKA